MTRYQLPPELGGVEIEGTVPENATWAEFTIMRDGRPFRFALPISLLTKVKPAWPEPPDGSVVRVWAPSEDTSFVAERDDEDAVDNANWFATDSIEAVPWAEITRRARRIIPLVPVEPVDLPWDLVSSVNDAHWTQVYVRDGHVVDRVGGLDHVHSPDEARDKARALWTAADQVEAAS